MMQQINKPFMATPGVWKWCGLASIAMSLLSNPHHALAEKIDVWKYDVELISSSRYVVNNEQLFCDDQNRLWAKVLLNFGENTDAYHARSQMIVIVSEDFGVTWRVSQIPWPGPSHDQSILPDGTIVETGTHYWERHPRSQIATLEGKGFYVWDLGKEANYCAILFDMWVRQSKDDGNTWQAFPVHEQFGFFSRLAVNSPPRQNLLADGTLITFAHGYRPGKRTSQSDLGGQNSPFILRSQDAGKTWEMIAMAEGSKSPSPRGFNEIYPVVRPDGHIFAMLRTALATQSFAVSSLDGGETWSMPQATPIFAKHPNPTELIDGTIVCSYQRRTAPPFGVRARFTQDAGVTWSEETVLRADIQIADGLVQPITVEMGDGTLFTIFSANKILQSGGRQSFIGGTRWTRNHEPLPHVMKLRKQIAARGSWSPRFALPPLKPRYNASDGAESPWTE